MDDRGSQKSKEDCKDMIAGVIKGLIVAAVAALLLGACGATAGGGDCTAKGASAATAATTVKVISDPQTQGAYDPKTVNLQTGGSVEWDWQDQGKPHSVTADDGSFDSCLQNAGHTFVVTFTKPGTYSYRCSIHGQMTGRIVVT